MTTGSIDGMRDLERGSPPPPATERLLANDALMPSVKLTVRSTHGREEACVDRWSSFMLFIQFMLLQFAVHDVDESMIDTTLLACLWTGVRGHRGGGR